MPYVKAVLPFVVLVSCMLGPSALQAAEPAEPAEPVEEVVEVDLGTHSPGARFSTSIAAHNVSCKGRHDFELVVRDAPWLVPAASTELTRIRKGRKKSTDLLVDTRGLEPGIHRGRIEVRCVTCPPPPKCTQDRTRVQVVLRIRSSLGDSPGSPGDPGPIDPGNPANPLDSYGVLHNAMLDEIAVNRNSIETAGIALPSKLAARLAGRVCASLEGAGEQCADAAFIQIASISMLADLPTARLLDAAGFSPEQRRDVQGIEDAIALSFDEAEPRPGPAIEEIERVEERVLQRTGIVAGGEPPRMCPAGWPPPCPWSCPLGPEGPCVPLPPVAREGFDSGIDHAILMASSTARHSIAYWHRQARSVSGPWYMAEEEEEEDDECKFWCKLWGVVKQDFKGALVGGSVGFVEGFMPESSVEDGVDSAWVGAAVGGVKASAKAAVSAF